MEIRRDKRKMAGHSDIRRETQKVNLNHWVRIWDFEGFINVSSYLMQMKLMQDSIFVKSVLNII